ncbi:MAG: hypothetical protein ACRC10_09820 [Thermoguttaceae bacterium]
MSTVTETLAPVEIWEVMLDDATIKFFEPLVLQPVILDRGTPGECCFAENSSLDISAVGVDEEELASCLRSDIRMTWKRVMRQPDAALSSFDRTIKARFLERAEEIENG